MRKRLLYLVQFYLLTVLLFIVAKVVFMLYNGAGHDVSLTDALQVVWHGMSLDLSTALYFFIVPYLLTIVSLWVKYPMRLLKCYYAIMAFAFALTFTADTILYEFWGFKLDTSCLQYLSTPKEAMASVSWWFMLLALLTLILLTVGIYLLFSRKMLNVQLSKLSPRHSILGSLILLLLVPVIIIGIRGGLSESTTNIGQVYYSENQFLNHSAVNPLFSFFSTFEKTASEVPQYNFMTEEERAETMKGLYPTESIDTEKLLTTDRPNIVIILMESCGGVFTEDIGGRKEVMPRFNKLVHEGIYFASCYANSFRTDRGTLSTWSGYLSFPRFSIMKMPAKSRLLPGIAKTLRQEGYNTSYIYGGDINFTNMRSYLFSSGFEKITWMKDYSSEEQKTAKWGVRDDITFNTLAQDIFARYENSSEHPSLGEGKGVGFLIGYSTLSSHEPWDVPTHRLSDPILNSFNYLDECIGNFIDEMKKSEAWDDLLIILLPDHGYSFGGIDFDHEDHDHIPMLWLGGAVKEPRRIEAICNQNDVAATLLGQMGIRHDDFVFSRDVMSKTYTYPFAVHNYNNGMTMVDSTGFMVYDLNSNTIIVNKSTDAERMVRISKAILQTTAKEVGKLGNEN